MRSRSTSLSSTVSCHERRGMKVPWGRGRLSRFTSEMRTWYATRFANCAGRGGVATRGQDGPSGMKLRRLRGAALLDGAPERGDERLGAERLLHHRVHVERVHEVGQADACREEDDGEVAMGPRAEPFEQLPKGQARHP